MDPPPLKSRPMQSPFQLLLDLFDEPKAARRDAVAPPAAPQVRNTGPRCPAIRSTGADAAASAIPTPTARPCWATVLRGLRIQARQAQEHRLLVGPRAWWSARRAGCRWAKSMQAVREQGRWIVASWKRARSATRLEAARIEWKDGATFPFLGEPGDRGARSAHGFASVGGTLNRTAKLPGVPRITLHIGLSRRTPQPSQIRDAVQAWLMRQAKQALHRAARPLRAAARRALAQAGAEQRRHALGHGAQRTDPSA
jgi:hypothetical protein